MKPEMFMPVSVEYFISIGHRCFGTITNISVRGDVQKSLSSKAATVLTCGVYSQYVSTAKRGERRWPLFPTLPACV